MQRIQNRAVVLSLQKNGDTLSAPRSVDHWLYFSSDSEVEAAVERVVQLGFIVGERSSTADSKPGRRLLLRIRREDRVDLAAINEVTTLLFCIANECGGEYDGWESPVVRDA
jgi:regulator of RNase E activity RraB